MLIICGAASAQSLGTTPKPKPEDYPVHARPEEAGIAAEYLVHTLPAGARSFVLAEYLVVEVALYPPRSRTLEVAASRFTLRINGRKRELRSENPAMVIYSVRYGAQDSRRAFQVDAGPVILGRPRRTARFPGDPTEDRDPQPGAPQPAADLELPPGETAVEAIERTALQEGPVTDSVSGYLFFPFKGKLKSIESLDLVFHGETETVLPLLGAPPAKPRLRP